MIIGMKFNQKKILDLSSYQPECINAKAYYGLPKEVQYCSRCVISNQRPQSAREYEHTSATSKSTIGFEGGICDACRYADQKQSEINWNERDRQLRELCDRYRRNDGRYDCIVPGSGGKDSFFTSHILRYKYGMNPLTVTWAPNMYTPWGWKNMEAWSNSGFDNVLISPRRDVQRLFTRIALENLLHPFQPFQFGQKFMAPRLAKLHNVNLVFYGEHQAEYGNSLNEAAIPRMDAKYFSADLSEDQIFIGGERMSEYRDIFGLGEAELKQYKPLSSQEVESTNLEFQYLGYYVPWHPQGNYYYAVEHGGFVTAPNRLSGTFTKYCSIDDKMEEFNFYLQGIKFGLGWTSYNASFEVRSGDLLRSEAVALVKRYDHEFPETWLDDFLKYVSLGDLKFKNISNVFEFPDIDRQYFVDLVDSFRSPHIWQRVGDEWRLRKAVEDSQNDNPLQWVGNA